MSPSHSTRHALTCLPVVCPSQSSIVLATQRKSIWHLTIFAVLLSCFCPAGATPLTSEAADIIHGADSTAKEEFNTVNQAVVSESQPQSLSSLMMLAEKRLSDAYAPAPMERFSPIGPSYNAYLYAVNPHQLYDIYDSLRPHKRAVYDEVEDRMVMKKEMPGVLRFGKRLNAVQEKKAVPGVLRFGKRSDIPGVLRFGKRSDIPGVLRFGKRYDDIPGVLRFGKREIGSMPGVLRFGKRYDDIPGVLRFGRK